MSTPSPLMSSILRRWFIQYNPFFTASALCVLGGVLALSMAMGSGADIALTVVLEVYQWLLVGAAALLYRRLLKRRPAVILGIILAVYMVDPTLQVAALASTSARWMALPWLVAFALKARALAWAFRLRLSRGTLLLPVACAAVVVGLTNARTLGVASVAVLGPVLGWSVFALGLLVRAVAPRIDPGDPAIPVDHVMFRRIVRAMGPLLGGMLCYHGWNIMLQVGPVPSFHALLAVALLWALAARTEKSLWTRGAVAAFAGLLLVPTALASLLYMAAVVFLIRGRRGEARLLTMAIALGYVALRAAGWPGVAGVAPSLVAAFACTPFLVLVWRARRTWSAPLALVAMYGVLALETGALRPGLGAAQWGLVLLVGGFTLLGVGVWLAARLGVDDADAPAAGPSSPAAVPGVTS